MKHKTAQEENISSEKTVDGPGSQLRKARERKGLEQSKMAAQLHLSQSMIQALEWDDYEKLPAAVFVQGYLRNYARLLGVDEDAVIHAFQELNPNGEQQPLPRNQPDEVARELHSDHRLIRLITWLVVLILGVLIFFWWQGRMDLTETTAPVEEQHDEIEPGFAPPQQGELTPPPDEALPEIREPVVEPSPSSPDIQPEMNGEPPVMEQPAIETPTPETDRMPEPEPAIVTTPAPAFEAPEIEPEPQSTTSESEREATMPESEPAVPSGSAGLVVFEFSGSCWVEVRDATGRTRIIGVMQEGMRRSLNAGLGPFQVVIGDINAARLSVKGEAYDLRRHARGKVARFTLDPSRL